jgi:hypothetical protein
MYEVNEVKKKNLQEISRASSSSPNQGCHGDGRTDMSVCPSVTSDKVLVRQIRVNAMLTYDKVKPELLCPQWQPRCCHVGWLDVSFQYIARAAEYIVLWRARMAAIGARTATEWGAHG